MNFGNNNSQVLPSFFTTTIGYHELIECITNALEERDQYTAGHSKRVSELVKSLCAVMHFSSDDSEFLHIAAHLHDIGKIGISDVILLKPGKLTDSEFAVIRQHPIIGARILFKSPLLAPLAKIVLHHHERFDGNGYPDGLSGVEIPLGSRIIAVCDSIDAMMSNRSYRHSFMVDRCYQEISANQGKMYDPDIVDSLLAHWDTVLRNVYSF